MSLSHEDVRYRVVSRLRDVILRVIDRIRRTQPEVYSELGSQLEEYREIIRRREDIPVIIKNERLIRDVGKPDVEVFGGRILVEVKVRESEFRRGFEQLSEYVKHYPYARYAVITNYVTEEFYRVENGKLILIGLGWDDIVEDVLVRGVKVSLSTENVRNMFRPIILLEDELYRIFNKYGEKGSALFRAYRNIMRRLYEKASDEEVERLFIRHTLMQMIVSSCMTVSSGKVTGPVRACSGGEVEIEIVLPYLNWWESLIKRKVKPQDVEFLKSLAGSIYSKALLLDWESGGEEDIFRELYEILIDAETRRKIGEYYTPLWLVEYMINKVFEDRGGLKGKIVLDPFCGSGTFLVATFYKKVEEGEDPDDAIREVIGFDINPLAVSIARAELMIAYQTKRKGPITPLVFNTDSASLLLRTPEKWEPVSFLDELREIENKIEYIESPIFTSTKVDFSEILRIEVILRECFREASRSGNVKPTLNKMLCELGSKGWRGPLTSHIIKTLTGEECIKALAELIEKYGNGVWAVSITSLFAPYIIRKLKVDVVVTNPPWALLTEPKGSYGKLLRTRAKQFLTEYKKTGQILTGSDISSVLLYGCINIARDRVAFLMPKEVIYVRDSYYGAGKILTYNIIRNYDGEIIEVNFDAFQHGRFPGIIFLKKKRGEVTCSSIIIDIKGKKEYSKALHLFEIKITRLKGEKYNEYMRKVILYTEISSQIIKERLNIEEVVPKGDYIMGLFGGEKKKEAKKYAGLIFEVVGSYDKLAGQYRIRLHRTTSSVKIPEHFLNRYWKKLIYEGEIFPFFLNKVYNILLSSEGKENTKEFLRRFIVSKLPEEDREKVEILIEEFRQPNKLKTLAKNKYYVIYRCDRNFVSYILTPTKLKEITDNFTYDTVIESHCSFISSKDKQKTYYYSAILNYLAYKVTEKKGAFERHQFLRPLIAILRADLEWRGEDWQIEVAELGKRLHQEAPNVLSPIIRKGMRVSECFKILRTSDKTKEMFKDLIKTIDAVSYTHLTLPTKA